MFNTTKMKYVLGLVIVLVLLTGIALPLILQSTQTAFPPQPSTLAGIPTPSAIISKANPQPQPNLWWNYSYTFRQEINVTEPGYTDRINEPAVVHLTFTSGTCNRNSTKLTYYNSTTSSWVKLPSQVVNATPTSGTYITSCDLIFPVNVTKSGTSTYYLYYNDTFGSPEPEPSPLSVTPSGNTFLFNTGAISGYYQAYSPDTVFDDDASFQQFIISGLNIIPSDGVHKGIDRADADDNGRFGLGNTLNWTINIIENGPIRAIVTISKTSTDNFASAAGGGSWAAFNKTYTFYAYTGIVSILLQNCTPFNPPSNAAPIYDFASIALNSSWDFYVDNNNLGAATSVPFTDVKAGVQPQNYMTLVLRTSGIGLGLLGYPQWPRDTNNGTSVEYGWGIDSGISFGVRNDMRGGPSGGEYYLKFPCRYYAVGLTGGFNQSVNTWYQVNHPVNCTSGNEIRKIFPLQVNVTDNFGNPISGANVTVYNDYNSGNPTGYNTSGLTNSLGQISFPLNESSSSSQYGIQAYVSASYWNYSSQAIRWNTKDNFTAPLTNITIAMNITSIYFEVYDSTTNLVQNANVTLNYTNVLYTPISQEVNRYFANCSFYAWANQQLNINVTAGGTPYGIQNIVNKTTGLNVTQPINMTGPLALQVHLNFSLTAKPTYLQCVNGTQILNMFWSDNITFNVWLNSSIYPWNGIDADWMNFTIYDSNALEVYNGAMTYTGTTGLWAANFNTTLVGLSGNVSYTITVVAKPSNTTENQYPTPINIFLPLQKLPVTPTFISSWTIEWTQNLGSIITISVYYLETHRNQPVVNEAEFPLTALSTISGTTHVNENMTDQGSGHFKVLDGTLSDLTPGQYNIQITATKANYSIPSVSVSLTINSVPTHLVIPTTRLEGFFDQNISISALLEHATQYFPILDANVTWTIRENTSMHGYLTDSLNVGNYSGQITNGTLNSGIYTVAIQASKTNYTTQFEILTLNLKGTPTRFASATLIPQLFGSWEYLFAGSLVQVENSWIVAPLSFTYVDRDGVPVPNATITVTGGLPVFRMGSSAEGASVLQVHASQLGAGSYLVLVPTFGIPPTSIPITILISATNYEPQQISFVVSIKERAIAITPSNRVPVSTFITTFAAIALPVSLFLGYTFIKRARIPALIKRIDELIRAISRGEKVEVKFASREKLVNEILSEELAILGLEPKAERYMPSELADRIVPLLVESKMKSEEAYALAVELKTAAPQERERLLESVGISGEISALVLQMIEDEEERHEIFKKSQPKPEKTEAEKPEPAQEEPKEEPKPVELNLEALTELEEPKEPDPKETELKIPEEWLKPEEPKKPEPEEIKSETPEELKKLEPEKTEIKTTQEMEELKQPELEKTVEPQKVKNPEETSSVEESLELEEESGEPESGESDATPETKSKGKRRTKKEPKTMKKVS